MVKTEFVEINLDSEFSGCVNCDDDIDSKSTRFGHHRHKSEGDIHPKHKLDDFIYPDFKFDSQLYPHFKPHNNECQKSANIDRSLIDIENIDDSYHKSGTEANKTSNNGHYSPYHKRYSHPSSESNRYSRYLQANDRDRFFDYSLYNFPDNTSTEDNSTSSQRSLPIKEFCRRKPLDVLLHEIYRLNESRRQSSVCESDTLSEGGPSHYLKGGYISPNRKRSPHWKWRKQILLKKDIKELRLMRTSLKMSMASLSAVLVKEVKKKDRFLHKFHRNCDVITAILHALSPKTREDTRMRFSVEPFAGDSGFTQWHDAMKMCARLPGGIPPEFRRRMWLTLAEQHVRRRGINWKEAERTCFNEWASPDDEGLGDQIIKDLHRTGCSLFCGADAEGNQALLKRVLLGYARWNKNVGYCQGFNMLAAIILEVMDRQESDALKVMIYLIEGVLPESYFANNLRGLSVDMAVFRELMRVHLPELSRHLEQLQHEAADQATGACYEPPLTNVFTMQWFLTLFSNCLPRDTIMRVWDLTFLQGNEMLLRTALAIWGRLSSRILEVPTADEFYCVMGDLTRKMLTHGLMDTNQLVQTLIAMAPFPFPGLAMLRDKYTYNITPWAQSVSSVARKGFKIFLDEDDEDEKIDHEDVGQKVAIAAAFGLGGFFRKSSDPKPLQGESISGLQQHQQTDPQNIAAQPLSGMTRPNLDISALKKQYSRLRERQKQAHIILTASNIRRRSIDEVNRLPSLQKTNQLTMKHLLRGKKALTTKTKRVVAQGVIPPIISKNKVERKLSDSTGMKKQNGGLERTTIKVSPKPNLSKTVKSPSPQNQNEGLKNPEKEEEEEEGSLSPPSAPTDAQDEIGDREGSSSPTETLHWKDTPRRARRASLPYGVKLMESLSAPLPDIKDDDIAEEFEDDNSSTSTELCDEDLAVLSEEELSVAIPRAVLTSPRLENHDQTKEYDKCFNKSSKIPELVVPKSTVKVEEFEEGVSKEGSTIKQCQNVDIKLNSENLVSKDLTIPLTKKSDGMTLEAFSSTIVPPSIQKASLSSPTKWKWSFSEIENPDLILPVSPILKLHNFLSQESVDEEDNSSLSLVPPSPKIVINNDANLPEECPIQYDPSSIFAYLFEITDVSKLSNVNSEEPSPIEDLREISFKSETELIENVSEEAGTIDNLDGKDWTNSASVRDRFSSFISLQDPVSKHVERDETTSSQEFYPSQKDKWKSEPEVEILDQQELESENKTCIPSENFMTDTSSDQGYNSMKTDTEIEESTTTVIKETTSVNIFSDTLQKRITHIEDSSDKHIFPKGDGAILEINKPSVEVIPKEDASDNKKSKEFIYLNDSNIDNTTANKIKSQIKREIVTEDNSEDDIKVLSNITDNDSGKSLHLTEEPRKVYEGEAEVLLSENNKVTLLKEDQNNLHKDTISSNLFSKSVYQNYCEKEEIKVEKSVMSEEIKKTIISEETLDISHSLKDSDVPLEENGSSDKDKSIVEEENKTLKEPSTIHYDVSVPFFRLSHSSHQRSNVDPGFGFSLILNDNESKASRWMEVEKEEDNSLAKVETVTTDKGEANNIGVSNSEMCIARSEDDSSTKKVKLSQGPESMLNDEQFSVGKDVMLDEDSKYSVSVEKMVTDIPRKEIEKTEVKDSLSSLVSKLKDSQSSEKEGTNSKEMIKKSLSESLVEGNLPYEIVEVASESQSSSLQDFSEGDVKNVDLGKFYFSRVFKSLSLESDANEVRDEETDEDSSDMSDPAKELTTDEVTEVIRRKLWAGVKSLSLDADLLIATNKAQKCYLDFSSSLPTLDESPSNETNCDYNKESKQEREGETVTKQRKGPKRRKSEAALKLMKENTKIIDQILNQRYGEENDNIFLVKRDDLGFKDRPPLSAIKSESLSDHNISESLNENETTFKNCKIFRRSASHESLENVKTVGLDRSNSFVSSVHRLDDGKALETETESNNTKINSTQYILHSNSFHASIERNESKSTDLQTFKNDDKITESKNDIEGTSNPIKVSPPLVPFCKLSKLSPKTKSSSKTLLNGSSKSLDFSSNLIGETTARTSTSSCQTSPEEPIKQKFPKLRLKESLSDIGSNVVPDHIQVRQQPSIDCITDRVGPTEERPPECVELGESTQNTQTLGGLPWSESVIPAQPAEHILVKQFTDKNPRQHFNPFPTVKPLNRPPKNVALKLGLYNSSKYPSDFSTS